MVAGGGGAGSSNKMIKTGNVRLIRVLTFIMKCYASLQVHIMKIKREIISTVIIFSTQKY